jgi:molybdenum cofactor biosynthesis enzyme MoaA
VRRFFEIVDTVSIFNIGGGEPLLNKCLPEFISFVGTYRQRIQKRFEVVTNGTIVPNDDLLQALCDNDAFVLLDDYGPNRSKNAQVVEDKLTA